MDQLGKICYGSIKAKFAMNQLGKNLLWINKGKICYELVRKKFVMDQLGFNLEKIVMDQLEITRNKFSMDQLRNNLLWINQKLEG